MRMVFLPEEKNGREGLGELSSCSASLAVMDLIFFSLQNGQSGVAGTSGKRTASRRDILPATPRSRAAGRGAYRSGCQMRRESLVLKEGQAVLAARAGADPLLQVFQVFPLQRSRWILSRERSRSRTGANLRCINFCSQV